ncbi:MAG TPA: hypothetical protein DD713_01730 [Nitrospiraceae bacterium]|nr:hypothetical protein [Nitrospiraceae bacterium]
MLQDCGRSFTGNLKTERCVKEAIHELGHAYNLGHCPDPRCIMFFSNRLRDTDVKGTGFCSVCKMQVKID